MGGVEVACTVLALGVVVGVTAERCASVEMFDRHPGPPDVIVPAQSDEVAFIGELTARVLERTRLHCVHAGVLSGARGAVVIPGRSGLGKSTLTVALVRAGFGYLSDEAAGFATHDATVHGFPRRPTLDQESLHLLGMTSTDGRGERAVSAAELGPRGPSDPPIAAILLVERGPELFRMREAPASEAAAALIRHSFNHFRDPAGSLRTFALLATRAEVFRVRYSSAPEAAARLAEVLL